MPQMSTASKLAELAEDQWGLLTRRQAQASGVSPATLQRLSGEDGPLERMTHGVYHLVGAPLPDHAPLRAAWLALAPETPVWERGPEQGVVSHRSAAAMYGLGELPADRHEFIAPGRRQMPGLRPERGRRMSSSCLWPVRRVTWNSSTTNLNSQSSMERCRRRNY